MGRGKRPRALTHIVLSGRWPGAWCPFLSCCSVVVAAAAAMAVGLAGVVAEAVVNE